LKERRAWGIEVFHVPKPSSRDGETFCRRRVKACGLDAAVCRVEWHHNWSPVAQSSQLRAAGQDEMTVQRKHAKTREAGEFPADSLAHFFFSVGVPDGVTPFFA